MKIYNQPQNFGIKATACCCCCSSIGVKIIFFLKKYLKTLICVLDSFLLRNKFFLLLVLGKKLNNWRVKWDYSKLRFSLNLRYRKCTSRDTSLNQINYWNKNKKKNKKVIRYLTWFDLIAYIHIITAKNPQTIVTSSL